jgi:hypothetical protein
MTDIAAARSYLARAEFEVADESDGVPETLSRALDALEQLAKVRAYFGDDLDGVWVRCVLHGEQTRNEILEDMLARVMKLRGDERCGQQIEAALSGTDAPDEMMLKALKEVVNLRDLREDHMRTCCELGQARDRIRELESARPGYVTVQLSDEAIKALREIEPDVFMGGRRVKAEHAADLLCRDLAAVLKEG